MFVAGMAELVDAHDSKSCGAIHESSILSPGTTLEMSKSFGLRKILYFVNIEP